MNEKVGICNNQSSYYLDVARYFFSYVIKTIFYASIYEIFLSRLDG